MQHSLNYIKISTTTYLDDMNYILIFLIFQNQIQVKYKYYIT